jgi:ammonia channel protein AmtB
MDIFEQIFRGVIAGVVGTAVAILVRRWKPSISSNVQSKWVLLKRLLDPDALALVGAIFTFAVLWIAPRAPFTSPGSTLDPLYVLLATVLVYFMQFGFIAFEAGAVHRAYGFESAVKNLLVFLVAYASYLWPGTIIQAWVNPDFSLNGAASTLNQAFNAGFASTVALIVANTLTERTSLPANLVFAGASAAIGYPFLAGLVWGKGWLAQHGFVDSAGGCVVHLFGGCVGLFAAYRIGPRFRTQGWSFLGRPVKPDQRALIPLTIVGGLFLWFGWLGFNSGSAHGKVDFVKAFLNTSLGACGGGFAAIFIAGIARAVQAVHKSARMAWPLRQMADLERVLIGLMGGLVCVTANASLVQPWQAFIEAVAGGFAAVGITALVSRFAVQFDDPLAAVATHAGAGLVGVIVFTPLWVSDARLLVQLMGCGITAVCAWLLASIVCVCFVTLEFLVRDRPAGLFECIVRNLRLRLSASRQVTGKMGFEPWGAAVEIGQALGIVRDGFRTGKKGEAWRLALGELAMAEQPYAVAALQPILDFLEDAKSGGADERQLLTALAMVCESENLERCLESCLSREMSHVTSVPGWTSWSNLAPGYREVLIWTIASLADRVCFENMWVKSVRANTMHLFSQALNVLRSVQRNKHEPPTVREIARQGQLDLENSNLYRQLWLTANYPPGDAGSPGSPRMKRPEREPDGSPTMQPPVLQGQQGAASAVDGQSGHSFEKVASPCG